MKLLLCLLALALSLRSEPAPAPAPAPPATPAQIAADQAEHDRAWALVQARKRVEQLMRQDQLANEGRVRAAEAKRAAEAARIAKLQAAALDRNDREGRLSPDAKAERGVVVDRIGVRKLEDSGEHTYFSWQARVTNATATPVRVFPELRLLDKKGFVLHESVDTNFVLAPGASQSVSGKSITKRAAWAQYDTFEVRTR